MSDKFTLEIISPDQTILKKETSEVSIPSYEGQMGILKDHIPIISFLKPGIVKIKSKSGEDSYYVEDGIIEFKDNNLTVLTSSIFNLKNMERNKIQELLKIAEEETNNTELSDQAKYLTEQKINVLRSIN